MLGSRRRAALHKGLSGDRSPARSQVQAATVPPRRVTRAISARPVTGSCMKWTTSWASVWSNCVVAERQLLGGGAVHLEVGEAAADRLDERLRRVDGGDLVDAQPVDEDAASGRPGPQPTSSARSPRRTPTQSAKTAAERLGVAAHEPAVRLTRHLERHLPDATPARGLPASRGLCIHLRYLHTTT